MALRNYNTREEKEQDRIRHVDTLDTQTGPIFLAYRFDAVLKEIIDQALFIAYIRRMEV